ncbi:TonB-dependent siderophore receptor [Pseudothauera nasutitermitis]|uniref:TonB-dependent siderophore receptor n=2 Tax=Pseudothauera nasutitermitis TaxID=2565930 RepID=A0A4S4B2C2_9RHOO|nr:TonB-dependent siderophore receptor [Pseudothauera nasutitermitis]
MPPAQAQAADEVAVRQFDIAGSDLDTALGRFGRQSGTQIAVNAEVTAGLSSPGVRGTFTVAEGLRRLLAGTGLEAVRDASGEYTLRKAPPAAGSTPKTLSAVQVTANQLGEISEHTGSYTPGAIATATRLVLTPRETPQSISVVTRQEMDDFNLTTIDKVMAHTPGVSIITYDSERTEFHVRGFGVQNFQYDGIPMERDSSYSAGNTLSDMAIYDRVEVLKGATGLLTGSGEPGATINLIRKKPTRDFQGHATLGAGSWNNYRGELDFSGALNEAGSLRGRVVVAQQDKHSHLDGYQRRTSVFYGVLEADLTPGTLLTVGVDYQDNDPKGSTWGGIPIYDSNGNFNKRSRSFNSGTRWSSWAQYTRTAFATLEHYFDNDWVAKLQLNHQINGYDAPLGSAGGGNPDPADGSGTSLWLGQYKGKTRANAADFYASGPFELLGRKHELVLGGSISERTWTNKSDGPNVGYPTSIADYYGWNGRIPEPDWNDPAAWHGENRETTRENGLYTTARWNLRDNLKLITGARLSNYKRESMRESGVLVPYLGAVYDINDTYSVYGSYTSIFKPQSARDESGSTLDPQEGNNYELGVKGAFFGGRLNASAAVFRLEQDNYAEETGNLTPDGGTAYRAINGVRTKGYELEMSGQLNEFWSLHAGFTHKVARQQGEKVSTLTPENQFSLFTTYKPGGRNGRLTLGGGARWQDKTWGDVYNPAVGTVKHTVDDYWLVDAMANWRFSDKLSASLNISNLFDKKYYTIFNWYSTYTWGEPRSVNLSVKYTF